MGAFEMRLNECKAQIEAIRSGLACSVPIDLLSLWSWRDLERRVCGDSEIDLALLKKYAKYEGSLDESSSKVIYLWGALESWGQEDRANFVRFCWGRSRLPPDGSPLWGKGFRIKDANDLQPGSLPRSHTCFFALDLPEYASQEEAS